ncbi:MAG: flagellar motor protein MotB [Thermodesulfobacteriota bacterium]|nr:flagellar motor protein MotB [Thermodesulfobacteriota bacterium]
MKNKHEDSEDKGGKWLTTFNDMVTLLLTFLVLVLSLSASDQSKLEQAAWAMKAEFDNPKPRKEKDVGKVFTPFVIPIRNKAMMFKDKKRELAKRINKAVGGHEGIMDARVVKESVFVTIGEKLLFETGMAEIKKRNNSAFKVLCPVLKKTVCQIRIEGHTDNVPISNKQFSSNWELSTARAVNVVKYFISEGGIPPERLSAAGYADSKPIFPNVSDHNRNINRRVEVVLALKR